MRAILAFLALAAPAMGQPDPSPAPATRVQPPARPQPLVKRGEPVVIAVRAGGLVITSQGRALGSAGVGESIRVISNDTHRTLDGVVEGPGSVRIPLP